MPHYFPKRESRRKHIKKYSEGKKEQIPSEILFFFNKKLSVMYPLMVNMQCGAMPTFSTPLSPLSLIFIFTSFERKLTINRHIYSSLLVTFVTYLWIMFSKFLYGFVLHVSLGSARMMQQKKAQELTGLKTNVKAGVW